MVAIALATGPGPQKAAERGPQEQTSFGAEAVPGQAYIRRPVKIPEAARQTLRASRTILRCAKAERIKPAAAPAGWFLASEIHLGGPNEIDFIVQPDVPRIVRHGFPPGLGGGCLLGAHTVPFWVLRRAGPTYKLLLETEAVALFVLKTRTMGHRDIQVVETTAVTASRITYRFDGKEYRRCKSTAKPAG